MTYEQFKTAMQTAGNWPMSKQAIYEHQHAEIVRLRQALLDAADKVEHWGCYADKWVHDKYDLGADVAEIERNANA